MTTLAALEVRTTTIEYAVFEQFPHTLEAMRHPLTQTYAVGVENSQAIAGLRVDMAALQTSLHRDVTDLKAALDLQGDSLRKELAVASAEFRTSLTGVRDEMSMRFQKVDGQFKATHADTVSFKDEVDRRFDAVGQRFDALDAKLDTLIAEIRGNRN